MYVKVFKRFFDILVSLVLLFVMLPIFIVVFIAIKLDDGGPIFFKQPRTGKDGKIFGMYKFRSMTVETEKNGHKLLHDERVTKVGRFLRKTSIDELPQIINVLKGEMSIIGPRPWVVGYYENFNEEQKKRCDVLPGITGLAQASGRNSLTVFEKIGYDIKYTKTISLKADLHIIFKSIVIILKREHAEIIQEDWENEIEQLKMQKA